MKRLIESAADLHREISKRGLDLKPEAGRDVALIADLADKLGIAPTRFMSGLKASDKTAEEYLRALMLVAEPFAKMFREIWLYLARHYAPKAAESLVIRFGFGRDGTDIDWNQFRVMALTAKKVRSFGPILLWPSAALFALSGLLTENMPKRRHPSYQPGESLELAQIEIVDPEDEIGSRAREAIQSLIDRIHAEWPSVNTDDRGGDDWDEIEDTTSRDLPELKSSVESTQSESVSCKEATRRLAYLLTDLIPTWGDICEQWGTIPPATKKKAAHYFHEEIEPLLESTEGPGWRRIREALDLLDLPFWRYRWHTYEVWASVKALAALDDFRPQLEVRDGHLAIDAATPALVAVLNGHQKLYVRVQAETKLATPLGKRRAIKPDLRISLDEPATNAETVAIVEFKQRRELDSAHVSEVLRAYSLGVGRSGGVVLINYDSIPAIVLPPHCILLGEVHPGRPDKVGEYQTAIRECLKLAQMIPKATTRIVLLDVSSSMGSEYTGDAAQRGLKRAAALSWVKIFRFNDGLVAGGDLRSISSLTTSGGTQLGTALMQLYSLYQKEVLERLIIVTDGGHDHPVALLGKVGEYRECTPSELEQHLDWLTAL